MNLYDADDELFKADRRVARQYFLQHVNRTPSSSATWKKDGILVPKRGYYESTSWINTISRTSKDL